jgi:threonylcarbamoyladenosine tRNA methylthiotransferase MtaB
VKREVGFAGPPFSILTHDLEDRVQGKPIESAGRVALVTQGCKVNQYETQVLLEEFLARGWELVPFGEGAELTVINSCTVTEGSDRDLRKLVSRARRGGEGGRILVTGCRAQVDPEGSAELSGVDFVVDNVNKSRIPDLAGRGELAELGETALSMFPDRVEDAPITRLDGRGRAILKIQDGCNLRCSFCIVPTARGDSRSRSAAQALSRAVLLEQHGYRELVLSGIQLGFYRDPDDAARDLSELLETLLAGTDKLRFRLGSLLPRHVTPRLRELFRSERDRLCPHFHISLQSGVDSLLREMKRPYRSGDFRDLLLALDEELDGPCLGTDVIVGFPTETSADHTAGLEFLDSLPLSYGHVFPFSPRAGTEAASMGDPVPRTEKASRGRELRELLATKGAAYRSRQLGRRLEVIVENRAPEGGWTGTSENYQRLRFEAPAARGGERLALRVSGLVEGGLAGELEPETTPPMAAGS